MDLSQALTGMLLMHAAILQNCLLKDNLQYHVLASRDSQKHALMHIALMSQYYEHQQVMRLLCKS